jgi:thioredoxin reductase (NADPH)
MTTVAIVGDGPAGLSAALFLARAGHETVVFRTDQTATHYAQLHNYLGIEEVRGSDFQQVARQQVTAAGAELRDVEVTAIARDDDGRFTVRTADEELTADHVVLAGGKTAQQLAAALGVTVEAGHVPVDTEYRTDVDRVHAATSTTGTPRRRTEPGPTGRWDGVTSGARVAAGDQASSVGRSGVDLRTDVGCRRPDHRPQRRRVRRPDLGHRLEPVALVQCPVAWRARLEVGG